MTPTTVSDEPRIEMTIPANLLVSVEDSFEFRKVSDHLDDVTSSTAAVLQETIKEVSQSGMYKNQRVKQVKVLSIVLQASSLIVQYELVLTELCINSCQEQKDSTTMYNDVTSHMKAEITDGGFTLSLQANALACGDDCNEIQNADVMGGTFGDAVIVVSTSEPSPNPTPKPSKRAKGKKSGKQTFEPSQQPTPKPTKRAKGKKSGKAPADAPTQSPTLNSEPSQKPTPKPSKRTKGNKRKRKRKKKRTNLCRGQLCDRKRIRVHMPDAMPLGATNLPSAARQRHTEYQPLRKRISQIIEDHQIEIYEVEQAEMEEKKSSAMPVSHPSFPTDDIIDSPTFYATHRTFDRKRIREYASGVTLSAQLLSKADQQRMAYKPTRKRLPKAEEHQINIDEVEQAEEEENISHVVPIPPAIGPIDSPTFNPTFDKIRIRKHMPDATPLPSTKLPTASNEERIDYQPLRKRRPQIIEEHQMNLYELNLAEKEGEKSSATPASPNKIPTAGSIYSPAFYPTSNKETASEKSKSKPMGKKY